MTSGDEAVTVVIRNAITIQDSIKIGVDWLDTVGPLLLEYNDIGRHSKAMTGGLVERD